MVQNGFWDEKKISKHFSLITPPKQILKKLKFLIFFFLNILAERSEAYVILTELSEAYNI